MGHVCESWVYIVPSYCNTVLGKALIPCKCSFKKSTLKCFIISSNIKTWLLTEIPSVSHFSFYTQDDDLLAIHRNFREVVMTYYTILFEPLIH